MKYNWPTKKLSEIALINPKETIKKGQAAKKIPMEMLRPFSREVLGYSEEKFSGGSKFRNGDTIMARITPCLENGKIAKISILDENEIGFGSTEFIVFRAIEGKTDEDFLYYLVTSPFVREPAIKSMVGSSGRQRAQTNVVRNLEIPFPGISVQRRIGKLLRSFDDKIELNNAMNKNLLEQAQIFLSKFMFNEPFISTPLEKFAEIIDCLHSKKPASVSNTTKQLIQLDNITDTGFLDLTKKYFISESDYSNWTRKCEIVEGDCVITNVGRIGAVSQAAVGTHAAMGRNMTCIRLKSKFPYYAYLITALLSPFVRREIMKNTDEGTIMGSLNVRNIPLLQFPMFDHQTMARLESHLYPLRKNIEINYLSNQSLSQIRDSLLPKLMSGAIDVSSLDF